MRILVFEDVRRVLVNEVDNVIREPSHVFGKDKTHMAERVLFIEDDLVSDLSVKPLCILSIGQLVVGSDYESRRNVELI